MQSFSVKSASWDIPLLSLPTNSVPTCRSCCPKWSHVPEHSDLTIRTSKEKKRLRFLCAQALSVGRECISTVSPNQSSVCLETCTQSPLAYINYLCCCDTRHFCGAAQVEVESRAQHTSSIQPATASIRLRQGGYDPRGPAPL